MATVVKSIEKGEELVVFDLLQGVVFMVVALTTSCSEAHDGLSSCFHPVDHVVDQIFFPNSSAFVGDGVMPIIGCCDELTVGGFCEKVASQLFG